MTLNQLKNQTR